MDKQLKKWPVQLKYIAKFLALGCFVIGTLLFTSYLTHPNDTALIYGLYFVVGALAVNILLLLGLLISTIVYYEGRHELLEGAGILLLNIPVAALYFFLLFGGLML